MGQLDPEPELYESWPAFMQGAINSLLLRGEIITLVTGRYANGQIARFITFNPDQVDVEFIDGRQHFSLAGEELPRGDVPVDPLPVDPRPAARHRPRSSGPPSPS